VGVRCPRRPIGFQLHKTISAHFSTPRRKMFDTGEGLDWTTGEALAFGHAASRGLSGRLSARFVARHLQPAPLAALVDQENEDRYIPLNHIRDGSRNSSRRHAVVD